MSIQDFNKDNSAIEITANTGSMVIFLIIGKFLSFLILGITFIVITRLLGVNNYGIYTLIIIIIGFFVLIGNFGISTTLNRFISEFHFKKNKRKIELLISNSFLILLITGIILTVLMFLFSGVIAHYVFHNASDSYLIEIASFIILITLIFSSSVSILIGFNEGFGIAITLFIMSVVQTIISIVLVVLNYGVVGPILGIIFGQLIGFFVASYFIFIKRKIKLRISFKEIKKILIFSIPLAISNAIRGIIPQLAPLFLVGILVYFIHFTLITTSATSNVILGNFGIASKVGYFIDIILGSISLSVLSIFSKLFSSNKFNKQISKYYNYSVYLAFVFISPLLLFIAILSKQFSYTFFSGHYVLAPVYLQIVSIGILISIFSMYASTLLISKNKVKEIMKININIIIIQLILMPVLLILFHGIGLIILLYITAPILSSIFLLKKINKLFKVKLEIARISKVLLANVLTLILIIPFIVFEPAYFIFLLIIGLILILFAYPILLIKTKAVTNNDLNIIKRVTEKIPVINIVLNFYIKFTGIFIKDK